ncbi:hypothetical protein BOTU111921_10535 [Bordetella tumbae]|uniref:hypothetical protein n=1 Tax=Bordetella tumbae TaxID=1649139 RepID=UPI0039EEE808
MRFWTIAAIAAAFFSSAAQAAKTDLELISSQAAHHFFVVSKPWILDSSYLEGVASKFCSGKRACVAHFWERGTPAAKALPMSDAQAKAEMATFQGNRMLWRCGKYKVATDKNCFSD